MENGPLKQKSPANYYLQGIDIKGGARDWNRTSTSLRTADFESAASTNSATRALLAAIAAICFKELTPF